ncbi:MAG: tyrosine-type recombinase/integrase [Terriglobia bacterium]
MASLPLDKITDQHARGFEAHHSQHEASTVNCGLRTLRRALSLACDWGKIDRKSKIALAKNENQRNRVLSNDEALAYLAACPQPWRDAATIIIGTGARPEEVYRLRWEQIEWRNRSGIIYMRKGKTTAAERPLPLLPKVYAVLAARHQAQGGPMEGWVFPSESASGHLMQGSAKNHHAKALKDSAVKPFAPYTLRHTGLTWIAPYCDAYTLAKIAGHTSITMTARYIHPQQNAIERTFDKMSESQKVSTNGDDQAKLLESDSAAIIDIKPTKSVEWMVSRGGIEPSTY